MDTTSFTADYSEVVLLKMAATYNSIKSFINECVQRCFGTKPTTNGDSSTTQPLPEQSLSESLQMLEHAVINLAECGHDADLATVLISIVIPHLTKLLNDSDKMVVNLAANMIYQFSKKDATKLAIAKTPQIIPILLEAMNRTGGLEIKRRTAGVFNNLSQTPEGLLTIYQSKSYPVLVEFLKSPIESIQFYSLKAVHNFLLKQPGSQMALLRAGAVEVLCSLLKENNEKFLAMVTDCLRLLGNHNEESKSIILGYNGHVELLGIMKNHTYETLLWSTAQLLRSLSTCYKNKSAIIQEGGMKILTAHLDHPCERIVQNCLWTLKNLSDAGIKESVDDLLRQMISRLGSPEENIVTCAAAILSNLTFNNQRNVATVRSMGGVEHLVRIIKKAGDCKEIKEPALAALSHLVGHHHRLVVDLIDENAACNSETTV